MRRRVAELEALLQQRPQPQVEVIEIPVVGDAELATLERLTGQLETTAQQLLVAAGEVTGAAQDVAGRLDQLRRATPSKKFLTPVPTPDSPEVRTSPTRALRQPVNGTATGSGLLPKAERLILNALAKYPAGRSTTQVALLTGYSVRGGGFNNALGALRSKGLVEGRGVVRLTGPAWTPPATSSRSPPARLSSSTG